jgi:hypothetical protein
MCPSPSEEYAEDEDEENEELQTDSLTVSTTRLLEAARVLLVVHRIYHTSNKNPIQPRTTNSNLHIF